MPTPAQSFIPIKNIKQDVVLLKDGSMRAVLMASSLNFALMSEEEQSAIMYRYQEFLNSLDFSTQILAQSRKLNIKGYLKLLESKKPEQSNELLQTQLQEYIEFIKTLTQTTNIMVKMFYIVVSFYAIETKNVGIAEKLKSVFWPKIAKEEQRETFLQKRDQLWQRVEFVQQTLGGTGVKLVPLKTQELIELYYNLYNPKLAEKGEPIDTEALNLE